MASSEGNRMLIIHQGALGDFVVTFPALSLAREKCHSVDILAAGGHGRLAHRFGLADDWFPLESAAFVSMYHGEMAPRLIRFFGAYRTILLLSFSKYLKDRFRANIDTTVLGLAPRPDPFERRLVAEHIVDGMKAIGLIDPLRCFDPLSIPTTDSLQASTGSTDGHRIIIHPGSGSPKKMWPLDRFMQIADACRDFGRAPAILLGPAEMSIREELAAGRHADIPLHTPGDMDELASLLLSSGAFIGNDSGVTHLAASCGLPTLAVFGPSDPLRWHPVGPSVAVVRPPRDLMPCFETDPDHCCGKPFFDTISVEMVLDALRGVVRWAERGE